MLFGVMQTIRISIRERSQRAGPPSCGYISAINVRLSLRKADSVVLKTLWLIQSCAMFARRCVCVLDE